MCMHTVMEILLENLDHNPRENHCYIFWFLFEQISLPQNDTVYIYAK